jgi:hypothetical protein
MALASYFILTTTVATLTTASPHASYYSPPTELHIPLLLKGELAPNPGTLVGPPAHLPAALFYAALMCGIAWLWRMAGRVEVGATE